jgi:4-aminobutyrate aminotransferase / (S)-3-amino-2-methylpropionate transaminase / 5-aminovalerate transaminase
VVAAVRAQAERMLHASFHVLPYEPYVRLAERLCAISPGRFDKKVMLVNSGAEAVENAVKIARYATGRPGVVTFENAFHGRTLLALTLTSRARNRDFAPLAPEVYRCPFPYVYQSSWGSEPEAAAACLDAFRKMVEEVGAARLAAVIMEPVQGEGGFVVPPAAFVQGVAAYCRERGILFIADEIQTGFYRTGRRFGVEHFDVTPDLMALAKSIADGLPLAAVVGRADLMDAIPPGGLGTTYGGNPVACVAALAVIDLLEREGASARARDLGARLLGRFRAWQAAWELIGDVRGLGAMVAMELVSDRRTKEPAAEAASAIVDESLRGGLVLVKAGAGKNVLRFLGPLSITDDELAEGLQILERAFARVCAPVSRSL